MTRREAADRELKNFGCVKDGNWHVSHDGNMWSIPITMGDEEGELVLWFTPNSTNIEDSYITDWE